MCAVEFVFDRMCVACSLKLTLLILVFAPCIYGIFLFSMMVSNISNYLKFCILSSTNKMSTLCCLFAQRFYILFLHPGFEKFHEISNFKCDNFHSDASNFCKYDKKRFKILKIHQNPWKHYKKRSNLIVKFLKRIVTAISS